MKREQMRWKTTAALAALRVILALPSGSPAQLANAGAPVASPARAASMLDQTAQPASIQLVDGKLMIQATNSSLRTILTDLEQRTGTKVEGLSRDERIFGVYGPGNPQEVLAAVLDDSGYNILISGRKPDGSPREIVLSTRTATVATPAVAAKTQAADEADEEGETTPPQTAPPPPAAATPQQVRTPQQMLEELQKMRLGAPAGTAQTPPQQ